MTDRKNDDLLTAQEAYRLVGLSAPKYLYRAAANGDVPSIKIGRRLRFSRRQLEAFIADGGTRR